MPNVEEWPELEKLKYEKEALDFYISSHPLAQFDGQLRRFRTHDAGQINKLNMNVEVRMAGMVTNFDTRVIKAGRKAGQRFAIFKCEDFTGQTKLVLWSEEYARYKDAVVEYAILIFEGHVERREGSSESDIIVNKIMTIDEAKQELTRGIVLRIPYRDDEESLRKLDGVASVLGRSRGNCPVYLSVRDVAGRSANFKLNTKFWVNVSAVQVDELELILGAGSVLFTGR